MVYTPKQRQYTALTNEDELTRLGLDMQTRKISDNQNLHTVAYLGLKDEAHSSGGSRFQKEFFGSGTEMRPSLSKSATDNNVYKCDNWWIDSEIKNTQLTETNVKWVPGTHHTSMSLLINNHNIHRLYHNK